MLPAWPRVPDTRRHTAPAPAAQRTAATRGLRRWRFPPTGNGKASSPAHGRRASGSNAATVSFGPLFILIEQLAQFGELRLAGLAGGKRPHHEAAGGIVE